jgi:signal transduction histidine kinase
VDSVATALAMPGATPDDLVGRALAFGADAFERGESLHHSLKGLDLLSAMMLYVMETSAADDESAIASEGIRLSRRLQQATSLLTLSVTKGYTQAMNMAMRGRFRRLRHDLRNPLGTIKSVLAMMDDETMPAEARANPRFRAMAKRNARSLGDLIAERLSDTEAVIPVLAQQSASLRMIACGVRRDLRAEAAARSTSVAVVGTAPARVVVDAIGLELMLHELLHAALQEAAPGDALAIELGGVRDGNAVMTLRCTPPRQPVSGADAAQYLMTLAAQLQGSVVVGEQSVTLTMPARPPEPAGQAAETTAAMAVTASADASAAGPPSGGGEPGYDIRGAREREHGESRRL